MSAENLQAQKAIQNAREALRSEDRSAARLWAEQAAVLAPQLEDPWLILASVASPRASVSFIERALQINPDSARARKGMRWALKRLQEVPQVKRMPAKGKQAKRAKRSAAPRKSRRRALFPSLLLTLGCTVIIAAAWTASTSPALASILNGESPPGAEAHPKVWAQVAIAKPTYTPQSAPALVEVEPILPPPTSTLPPPEAAPALAEVEPTLSLSTLEPTIAPTLAPPTPTLASPTSTTASGPTVTPEATSTPAGSLVMEIVEDTPVPTANPNAAPTAKAVQPPVGNGVRWIEVNLSEQRVYAWEGSVLMKSFIVSTGTWRTPTVTGSFSIWNKTRIQTMSGPGYSLPNVPWVMYFYKDYGFHGTYWHNNFGTPMSHGCVNMTIPDAQWLYNWASYGTTVNVHY